MLGKNQIGKRVVARRRAEIIDGKQRYRDVIGELLNINDDRIWVRRDNGDTEVVAINDVVAAKEIPPKPASYRAISVLERAAADTWPALENHWLGSWLLRASNGWTNRANTVLPLGDPGMDIEPAIDTVIEWYEQRGLQAKFAVPLPLSRRLASSLGQYGWVSTQTVSVQIAPITRIAQNNNSPNHTVVIKNEPDDAWLDLMALGRSQRLPAFAPQIIGRGPDRAFASIYHGTEVIASGRAAISGSVVVFSLIEVRETHRRQGLAGTIMNSLASWAINRGSATACVQVLDNNEHALALYQKQGFVAHHSYINMSPTSQR